MSVPIETLLPVPESIRRDIAGYADTVERFKRGELSPVAFRAYRVPMGIYEQRAAGTYMVRIRLGAGLLLPAQAEAIADLASAHGKGFVHLTTRQDIQLHDLTLEDTVTILDAVLAVGLSSRGGGGNTVRNISVSPRAHVAAEAVFDVNPHALALAAYLLSLADSFQLPRKLKIAFAAIPADGAFASATDLGFFATVRDGQRGFAIYGGGGLGRAPRPGMRLEAWIPETEIFLVAEAVKQLFDEVGDRTDRNKARLRHARARLGDKAFLEAYQRVRDRLRREGLPTTPPPLEGFLFTAPAPEASDTDRLPSPPTGVRPERSEGLYTLRLAPADGILPAEGLRVAAAVARTQGRGLLQATQAQELLITSLPGRAIGGAIQALSPFDPTLERAALQVVACAGASTCQLGLCLSRGLGAAIREAVATDGRPLPSDSPRIRISGCPNSCANHTMAELGFEGRAQSVGDRTLPMYAVYGPARVGQDEAELGRRLGVIPAKTVPDLVLHYLHGEDRSEAALLDRIEAYQRLPDPIPEDWFVDWGASVPFAVGARGHGECSTGTLDIVRAERTKAHAVADAERPGTAEAIAEATLHAIRALLPLVGVEPADDASMLEACRVSLIEPGWLAEETAGLLDAVANSVEGKPEALTGSHAALDNLLQRMDGLIDSLDRRLAFTLTPYGEKAVDGTSVQATEGLGESRAGEVGEGPGGAEAAHEIDLRGVACPINFVKAKMKLESIPVGETLAILLDDGEPIRNVPASFADQGQEVLQTTAQASHHRVLVRRRH